MNSKPPGPRPIRVSFGQAIAIGLGAGLLGTVGCVSPPPFLFPLLSISPIHACTQLTFPPSLTLSNKLEQSITGRPSSYVPGKTFAKHFGLIFSQNPNLYNHIHHWGTGILAGSTRALMSYYGIVGPIASFFHLGVRLLVDQIAEETVGVSPLPWTWPVNEQVVDLTHKAVYALVTGWVCDWYIRGVSHFVGLVPWDAR